MFATFGPTTESHLTMLRVSALKVGAKLPGSTMKQKTKWCMD